jgi:hypothetical protein
VIRAKLSVDASFRLAKASLESSVLMLQNRAFRVVLLASTLTTFLCSVPIDGAAAKTWWFGQSDQKPEVAKPCTSTVKIDFGAKSKTNPSSWVRGTIRVQAPPEIVWYSVHETRKKDPDLAYSKVLEHSVNEELYEEKFQLVPLVGSATCVLRDKEVPLKRIDYELVKSDHFKAMNGSWIFVASEDGKSTLLELTSHLDTGMPVPQSFVDGNLARKIERRLNHVKSVAEGLQSKVAVQPAIKID